MSKILRKASLATAVVGALAFTLPAFAVNVQNGPVSPTVGAYGMALANVSVASNTTTVTLPTMYLNVGASDPLLGQATDFTVTISLNNGQFASTPALANIVYGSLLTGWKPVASVAGGTGTTVVTFTVSNAGNSGAPIVNGDLLSVAGLTINKVATLANLGSTVTGTVTLRNAITNAVISTNAFTAATSTNPAALTITGGDTLSRIDILPNLASTDPMTVFSTTGVIGGGTSGSLDSPDFNDGATTIGTALNVVDNTNTAFTWLGTDTAVLTLTGKFGAFTAANGGSVVLSSTACTGATAIANGTGAVAANGSTVTFTNLDPTTVTGANLCFIAGGKPISETGVQANVVVTRATVSSQASATGLSMQLNGQRAVVYTFNPASNTNQQSMLRVTNTGVVGGNVTIQGTDDAGNPGAGSVSFNLPAGQSVYLSSGDLENGNAAKGLTGALGAGTGKWRLNVFGALTGMEVTNLNRNNSTGTLNNLGTPVDGAH